MSVDLRKNKDSLLAAWQDVVDEKSDTNWAVFGYEGTSNVLRVVEKGDGDLEEMVDELNSGKIMYAYCRVQDPNTNLWKNVIINWQGEGVPEIKKGAAARHINDIHNLFRGAHVTINARTEDDIDEETIKDKVAKSSGANYSFHKEIAKPMAEPERVSSVYKRTKPAEEIKVNVRDQFWEKQEKEEQQRIAEEKRKSANERKNIEMERKAREEHDQSELEKDYEDRRKRASSLRHERAAEAASLVAQRENDPRAKFEQHTSQYAAEKKMPPAPPKKIKHTFLDQQQQEAPPPRKEPIQLPREPSPPPREPSPPPRREPSPPPREPSPPPREPSPPRQPSPPIREPSPEPEPQQPVSRPTSEVPATRNLLAEGLPKRQDSDEEEEEEQNWDEPGGEEFEGPPEVTPITQEPESSYAHEDEPPDAGYAHGAEKRISGMMEQSSLRAKALYDYQAADETEITFDPDDIITNIEQVDEGWWVGTGPDGTHGMFPANYVELIEE
ncbi:drebrin-like protein B isoform X2 [Lingula anatina]|uniref:Drebrin-like protein B isoform X2 n=1 Tax=Lingula anatina TaxID=7574 RepID=A0A1S3I1R8_LINAN|nr:drebrin-like protein B isoform X2 [Lingula anatina]|eukprot:XP_013391294.1 drebrin-like protein B isoform X2 [Lingula anatina]